MPGDQWFGAVFERTAEVAVVVAVVAEMSLEGDFFDLAQFPELVILDPFGIARGLEQFRGVSSSCDTAVTAEQFAVQPTRNEHRHNRCL